MDYKCLINLLRRAPNTNIGMTSAQPLEWDAADAIAELIGRAEAAKTQLKNVEYEKKMAINDLRVCSIEGFMECQYCLYRTARSFCWDCTDGTNWRYRGEMENEYENK